ncbi:threonine dehydratase [Virgibacillus halotolerans]|uniref:pyridoxal-phosphate dependent enzyme n=1 Tax=Virgibacillus halotolerans TaxID=1071053 RepID=UPI0019604F3E|nr:pyridoxal-phosphate dependent enzyme [Virgibacillus halotolerans]MBM7600701.1 threonine dehydratase [Virgibacillus halotolerans]
MVVEDNIKEPIVLCDIYAARKRIASFVSKTPLIYSRALSKIAHTAVHLKLENLHITDSFKLRGAANKMLSLTAEERRLGVTTFSTGNFGMSVAYLANQLKLKAVICISERVPKAKVEALKRTGVSLEISGISQDDAEKRCYELEEEQGLTVIHPFDDPDVIAGQGTIGLELMEDLPETDTVIGGLSGGGLHSGLGIALKSADPNLKLIGVSTPQGAAMYESIKQGGPVTVKEQDTLADSLLGGIGLHNRYTFDMIQRYVNEIVLLNEQEIAQGMLFMLNKHRMIIEGAAASGIGALLNQKVSVGSHVVIIISGCSVDPSVLFKLAEADKDGRSKYDKNDI